VEAASAAFVSAVVRRLPRPVVLRLGGALGRLWAALDRRHLRIAADNLRRAFPEWDEAHVFRTARGVYAHFGTVLLDILWMERRRPEELLALTDVTGLEHLEAGKARGRGVVCPTGHFGNWELQGVASVPLVGPVSVIARPLDNPALDRRLVDFRTSTGNTVVYKQKALAQVLKTLRAGGIVAILIDQNVQEKDGVFVPFFGRAACTTTVAAALALKTGAAIVPVRCPIGSDGRYRMVYGPTVAWTGTGRRDEDVVGLTAHLTSIIESWVREAPEQWLWIHRRWKTQPSARGGARGEAERPAAARAAPAYEHDAGAGTTGHDDGRAGGEDDGRAAAGDRDGRVGAPGDGDGSGVAGEEPGVAEDGEGEGTR
jgi:Kdo2-lipid IVA lauroyltransferase/acyltransferase